MNYKELTEYKGFKVGDNFIIKSEPSLWDSYLNINCPLNSVLYPYKGKIIRMTKYIGPDPIAQISMTDGNYGWSLESLLEDKKIISLKNERRKKLKKINESR